MDKHAVVKRSLDGHDWITEVLPNRVEAEQWAEVFRDQAPPGVTYTVSPYAKVVTE